jgi:hypothetical protein
MNFRPAPRTREPALAMEPLVDPAGWTARELASDDRWVYVLSSTEIEEICLAVPNVERRGREILKITRDNFDLPTLDHGLALLHDEILEGRGFVVIRGLPIDQFSKTQAAIAFWGMGCRFGRATSQNGKGHMLGHVKDFGGDYKDPAVRGYQTNAEMSFHSDQCDTVALLCVQPSKSGGASRIASLVTIYNEMLKIRPDLVRALTEDFYLSRHGEIPPGEPPWYKLPVFSFQDGYFAGRGASTHVRKAQGLPGVPPFTNAQIEAFDLFAETARNTYFDMDFRPGDIQLLNNHVTVHTRSEFEDWPEQERKRHLMRLWLADESRPLVPGFRENIQGVEIAGMTHCAPVDSFEAA